MEGYRKHAVRENCCLRRIPLRSTRRGYRSYFFFEEDFFFGTFAPSRLASDNPIAIACLRLVTFLPLRPLLSVPLFFSCIARSTFLPALGPYFLPEDFFFTAIERSPFCCIGKQRRMFRLREANQERKDWTSTHNRRGRQNVFDVHPLRRVLARVAGDAEFVSFAAIARIT
jgi:hypothetical protein